MRKLIGYVDVQHLRQPPKSACRPSLSYTAAKPGGGSTAHPKTEGQMGWSMMQTEAGEEPVAGCQRPGRRSAVSSIKLKQNAAAEQEATEGSGEKRPNRERGAQESRHPGKVWKDIPEHSGFSF